MSCVFLDGVVLWARWPSFGFPCPATEPGALAADTCAWSSEQSAEGERGCRLVCFARRVYGEKPRVNR